METGHSAKSPNRNFVYQPLNKEKGEIRLLQFNTDAIPDTISCTITVHDIETVKRRYVAISYVWGDESVPRHTIVDNEELHLTQNGVKALHMVQRHKLAQFYWMDAICINQNDDAEKGHQVRLMSKIYSHAKGTAACIGDDDHTGQFWRRPPQCLSRLPPLYLANEPYFERMWITQEL